MKKAGLVLLACILLSGAAACGDWHIGGNANDPGTNSASAPSTPAWITATPMTNSSIEVDWATSSGATGYNLYQNNVLLMNDMAANDVAASGLENGTSYCYQVNAENQSGTSALSNAACATTLP